MSRRCSRPTRLRTPGGAKSKASLIRAPPIFPCSSKDSGADGFLVLPPGHGNGIALTDGGYYAKYQKFTMSEFAKHLVNWVTPNGGPIHYVADKTGLAGTYDSH